MSIFKSTFSEHVKEQLNRRQVAMTDRTSKNLSYLNSRNAWIRMSSSVNVNGTNDLAKQYILQGGTLKIDPTSTDLTGATLKSGVGNDFTKYAYSNTGRNGTPYRLGIRPMPGITSLDIRSKSAYGSLREATVNFQCWDINQLEDLELLYMRPGYTVLIEWGWVPYLDNTGLLDQAYISTFIDYYDIINKDKTSRTELFKELYDKSVEFSGNYDAMFGYIKNYSWKSRMDGGYDCSVNIISTGEIIESLKVNYAPPSIDTLNKPVGALSYFFNDLDPSNYIEAYKLNILAGVWKESYEKSLRDLEKNTLDIKGIYKPSKTFPGMYDTDNKNNLSKTGQTIYFNLDNVFRILNNEVIAKGGKAGSNKSSKEPVIKLSVNSSNYDKSPSESLKCIAHPLQLSIDPAVCVIKCPLWSGGTIINALPAAGSNPDYDAALEVWNTLGDYVSTFIPGTSVAVKPWVDLETVVSNTYNSNPSKSEFEIAKEEIEKILSAVVDILKKLDTKDKMYAFNEIAKTNYNSSFVGSNPDEITNKRSFLGPSLEETIKATVIKAVNYYYLKGVSPYGGVYTRYGVSPNTSVPLEDQSWVKWSKKLFDYFNAISSNIAKYTTTTSFDVEYANSSKTVNIVDTFTIDPTILESEASNDIKDFTTTKLSLPSATANVSVFKEIPYDFFWEKTDGSDELGIIKNIYINLDYLYKLALDEGLSGSDPNGKNEINLLSYLKKMMQDVQAAIGNINNFEIHVDPVDNNVARVIDVNYTEKNRPKYEDLFPLEVHNLNSTVRSYSLESKIFPEQGTMIAIGAQAKGGQLGMQTNTLIDFNYALTDRIIPEKVDGQNSSLKVQGRGATVSNGFSKIIRLLDIIDNSSSTNTAGGQGDYRTASSEAKNGLRDIISYFQSITKSPGSNRNLIPTKFSCEMDGIGGLVIGHMFRLPDNILPRGYKGGPNGVGKQLGNVITSIGHTISNGDWVTKIDTLNVVLEEPSGRDFFSLDLKEILANAGTSTGGGAGSSNSKPPVCSDYKYIFDPTKYPNTIVTPATPWAIIKSLNPIPAKVQVKGIGLPHQSTTSNMAYKLTQNLATSRAFKFNELIGSNSPKINYVVLHHTADNNGAIETYQKWNARTTKQASSDFVIDRNGVIAGFINFKEYGSWHYGDSTWTPNQFNLINYESIGIEIVSYGQLYYCPSTNKFYNTGNGEINIDDVVLTEKPHYGHNIIQAFTKAQISSLANLLIALYNGGYISDKAAFINSCNLNVRYPIMFPTSMLTTKPSPGLLTHGSANKKGKIDCLPQPNLLEMISDLPNLINANPNTQLQFIA